MTTLTSAVQKVLDGLRLPKEDRAEIDRFIKRPEVKQVFEADEIERLAHRRTLMAELKNIPAAIAKNADKADKSMASVLARFEAAEKEYRAAEEELRVARLAAHYAGYPNDRRRLELELELIKGADPRIREFLIHVDNANQAARGKNKFWASTVRNILGIATTKYFSNLDDIVAAREATAKAGTELKAMMLDALTHDQVTQQLQAISTRLKPDLWTLEMNPPTLDEHGAVKAPARDGFQAREPDPAVAVS